MDQLFQFVFFKHAYIRNNIYYQLSNGNNKKSIKYKDFSNLNILINNDYIEIVKSKLKNREFMTYDMKTKKDICKIKQPDIFQQCLERFDHHFNSYLKDQFVIWAADQNNWHLVSYLMDKGYNYNIHTLMESACSKGQTELVKKLSKMTKTVSLNSFIFAILSKNQEIVKSVFEYGQTSFATIGKLDRERVLIDSLAIGNLEIFKIVKKYFEDTNALFSFVRWFGYQQQLIWRLYVVSVINFETYKYIFDNFDLSFTRTEKPPHDIQYPPVAATEFGSEQVLIHMFENNLVVPDCINRMTAKALPYGHINLYELFKNQYKLDVSLEGFNLSGIKNFFPTLGQVKYIVEHLGIQLHKNDLLFAAKSPEIFKYIFEKGSFDPTMEHLYYCCKHNNLDTIKFLYQKGLVNIEWTIISNHILVINPNNCFDILKLLFTLYRPTIDDLPELMKNLEDASKKCTNSSVFRFLFAQVHKYTTSSVAYDKCILNACKKGRVVNLQLMIDSGVKPSQGLVESAMQKAAVGGHLSVIRYLINSYCVQPIVLPPTILNNAVIYNHFHLVQYLFPEFYDKYLFLDTNSMKSLGSSGNLMMVKYIYKRSQKTDNKYFEYTLSNALRDGYLDIRDYLISKGVRNRQQEEQQAHLLLDEVRLL